MSLHNDLRTWSWKAKRRGQDTIEIDHEMVNRIVNELLALCRYKEERSGINDSLTGVLSRLEAIQGKNYAKIDLEDVDTLRFSSLCLSGADYDSAKS